MRSYAVQEIKIVLTMDCEPTTATSHPAATGPATWSVGEGAVCGYVDIAAKYGLPVTLFVLRSRRCAIGDVPRT
jgi:hypothetical protein